MFLLGQKAFSKSQITKKLGYNQISGALKKAFKDMFENDFIVFTHKEKTHSRMQK